MLVSIQAFGAAAASAAKQHKAASTAVAVVGAQSLSVSSYCTPSLTSSAVFLALYSASAGNSAKSQRRQPRTSLPDVLEGTHGCHLSASDF